MIKITDDKGDVLLKHIREDPYVDDGLEYPEFEIDVLEQEELIKWFWKNKGDLMADAHKEVFGRK